MDTWFPVVASAIALITAVGLAVIQRRLIKRDRARDHDLSVLASQNALVLENLRCQGQTAFAVIPFDWRTWLRSAAGDDADFRTSVTAGMAAIAPIRQAASALPIAWRVRLDALAVMVGHFSREDAVEQLRLDLVDLMNGVATPRPMQPDLVFPVLLFADLILNHGSLKSERNLRQAAAELSSFMHAIYRSKIAEGFENVPLDVIPTLTGYVEGPQLRELCAF